MNEAPEFKAPATPGWQLLVNAATNYSELKPGSDSDLQIQLAARKNEKIPKEHRAEVAKAVFNAGVSSADLQCGTVIPAVIVEFLESQFGREGIANIITELEVPWELVDCTRCQTYHVKTTDPKRLENAVRHEADQIGARLVERLFGFDGESSVGIVLIEANGIGREDHGRRMSSHDRQN